MATAPKSAKDCFAEAAEAAGRPMSRDALEHYFFRAEGRINRYVREGMTPEGAAMRAGRRLTRMVRSRRPPRRTSPTPSMVSRRFLMMLIAYWFSCCWVPSGR